MSPKPKGVGVLIAVGKPKGGPPADPDDMPTGKAPIGGKDLAAHEAAESPAQEGAEDYGAKLVGDIEAVGDKHGLDPSQSHAIAADLFDAVARCLRGGSGDTGGAADMGTGGGHDMGGAGAYGQ